MKSLIILILAFTLSCVSTRVVPPTEEMANTYALLDDARIEGGEIYAPRMMKEAKSFYEQAEREFTIGNRKRAEEFRLISEIRAKTVMSIARKKSYEDEIQRLQSEINEANSIKKTHEEELRENISKLEQIKDRLAVSEEIMHSRALDILEKAGEKIKAAENVSAEYFSQEVLSEARQNYKEAEKSLSRGEYEKSVELAEKAVALAEKAHQVSKEKLDLKNKIIERVSSIYGARVEPTEKGIRITFDRLFAPSGTKILFDAYPSLDAIGNALTEYPNPHVTIEAYTNDLKSEDENIKLSQSQAETVKSYLVSKGLSPERLKAEGHGSGKSSGKKVGNGYIELIIDLVKLDNT